MMWGTRLLLSTIDRGPGHSPVCGTQLVESDYPDRFSKEIRQVGMDYCCEEHFPVFPNGARGFGEWFFLQPEQQRQLLGFLYPGLALNTPGIVAGS